MKVKQNPSLFKRDSFIGIIGKKALEQACCKSQHLPRAREQRTGRRTPQHLSEAVMEVCHVVAGSRWQRQEP